MIRDLITIIPIACLFMGLLWIGLVKETDRQSCLYFEHGVQYYNYEKCGGKP